MLNAALGGGLPGEKAVKFYREREREIDSHRRRYVLNPNLKSLRTQAQTLTAYQVNRFVSLCGNGVQRVQC